MKSVKVALLAGLIGFVGIAEAEELTAYYQSGYIGDHESTATDALKLTATSGGDTLSYTREHGTWTLIIDENTAVAKAEAWCADTVKYNNLSFKIVKVVIRSNFTFYPGVTANLFDNVEIEVAEGVKLTMTNYGSRNMSLGAVTFSGDGEVDASSGVAFTKPITTKGNVTVKTPDNAFVATVDGTEYLTLTDAFKAAKSSGTISLLKPIAAITPVPADLKDAAKWQGTLVLQEIDDTTSSASFKYDLQNLGNPSSKICLNGYKNYPCAPTNVSNVGRDVVAGAWVIGENGAEVWGGFSNFGFNYVGNLEGTGLLKITNTGDNNWGQNYVRFKGNPSEFAGSIDMTGSGYRLILAPSVADVAEPWTNIVSEKPMIHVSGVTAQVAADKTWTAKTVKIDGTISGSGTLGATDKVIFGNDAVIDLKDGALTASGAVTFGNSLTLKNVQPGDTILKCSSTPTNLKTVTLKDESGATPSLWSLKYENGEVRLSGDVKKLSGNESWTVDADTAANFPTPLVLDLSEYYGEGGGKPVGETTHTVITFPAGTDASTYLSKIQVVYPTLHAAGSLSASGNKIFFTFGHLDLYWSKWRGTFWEAVFGGDVHGNNGFGRTESGAEQAILAGDTVIFDKRHYQVEGEFAEQSPYWHYDENLYIKDEVNPGTKNDWDLKVLEGVMLKMGLRGARTTGQNIISDFKIYVDANSTLELGYWGNTHHYQGVIRPDVTFGGAGTITLGDDMGSSCRVEGDLKVKQDPSAQETEIPTLNVRGKELVVKGGQIDVNLTGFGALSGSGTITTPITFNNATISATTSPGFTFKNETTFTGTLTVDMTAAPTGDDLIKICTKGEGGSFVFANDIDVLVRVGGSVQPAFYTLATDTDGNLCVKVAPVPITYEAEVVLGYDYKTMICRVTMTPAIEGVVATVTVNGVAAKLTTWTAPVIGMRGSGRAEVMVGDADNNFEPGTYSITVSVGAWRKELRFELATQNDGDLAEVNGVGYKTMQDAVAVAGESGTIKLLTNVFFAPPPGNYVIERTYKDQTETKEYDIYITNDMNMSFEGGYVKINAPKIVDHYVLWTNYPFVIEGAWLGAALPWKTRKEIAKAISAKGANGLKPFEAYVLGIPAAKMGTYKPIVRGVQTDDPNTIELTDDLPIKDASETGVVVTRNLVDAETKEKVSASAVYDLSKMNGKSQLLRLDYSFDHDDGQD